MGLENRDNKEIALKAQNLSIGYRKGKKNEQVVHSSLNLELYMGEVTSLLGLNGAGKSTLIRTICGFQPSLDGTVDVLSRPLSSYSPRELSKYVGVVLTDKTSAGGINVYELVSLGRHPHTGFFGKLSSEDDKIIMDALGSVGMSHKATNYLSELSDGERQKVMIAKALAQECAIIILDEPTAFLDVTSRLETMLLLRRLASEQNISILLSTHDLEMALQMSDSLWLQQKNAPIYCGAPEDLVLSGRLSSFFSRDSIEFDSFSGRLTTSASLKEVFVSGDKLTSYWVENSLFRFGCAASSNSNCSIQIICHETQKIELIFEGNESVFVSSIAELGGFLK